MQQAPPAHIELLAESPPAGNAAALRAAFPEAVFHLHSVRVDVGSPDPWDGRLLDCIARRAEALRAASLSFHLSWTSVDGCSTDDLLPLPRTEAVAQYCAERLRQLAHHMPAPVLFENVSRYVEPEIANQTGEADFLNAVAGAAGCGILLDINNLYVTAENLGLSAEEELATVATGQRVAQVHLGGHELWPAGVRVDTHSCGPAPEVLTLTQALIARIGPVPCILEWDRDVPAYSDAQRVLQQLELAHALAA